MKKHFLVTATSCLLCTAAAFSQATDLPLKFIPSVHQADVPLVFFLSGDGGWARFCPSFSERLAANDLPVVGLNCKKYFWNTVEPQQAANDFAKVARQYLKEWNCNWIVWVGLSYGGDVLPFIFEKLPADLKAKTKLITLLSPSKTTDFQVHYADMVGMGGDHYPNDVLGSLQKIKDTPILCIYGDKEASVFPEGFRQANMSFGTVHGTHYYSDDEGVTNLILQQLAELK